MDKPPWLDVRKPRDAPGVPFPPMEAEFTIEWQQMSMGGVLHDRWVARITSPHLSVEFATVGWAELRGLWVLRFMPAGPGIRCPIFYGDYHTKEKAMAHVERWTSHHWQRVPVWVHPQRWGAG